MLMGGLSLKITCRKKNKQVESSKIGLNNIREKYLLLGQPEVVIEETAAAFIIAIPLIENMAGR